MIWVRNCIPRPMVEAMGSHGVVDRAKILAVDLSRRVATYPLTGLKAKAKTLAGVKPAGNRNSMAPGEGFIPAASVGGSSAEDAFWYRTFWIAAEVRKIVLRDRPWRCRRVADKITCVVWCRGRRGLRVKSAGFGPWRYLFHANFIHRH